mmetsp:Transcript_90810/g.236566  ORF Transcript_90810/g.236566 Transcript_90810/m.236566 type:complete len:382 (-) Transcript_90810:403-1548(-)
MGKRAAPTIVPPAAQLPRAKSGRSIGKELSAQPATPKAEPAKELAPADPLAEDCAALGGLLGQAQGLPTSCQEMLRAMMPHCLRTRGSARHAYQDKVAEVLEEIMCEVREGRAALVREREDALAEVQEQQAELCGRLEAAEAEAAARLSELRVREAALAGAAEESTAASVSLAQRQGRERSSEATSRAALEAQSAWQDVCDAKWAPLRDGAVTGREWRERNRMIDALVQALAGAGADASLLAALPLALKSKSADRAAFASKTVEHTEVVFEEHACSLSSRVASAQVDAAQAAAEVASAQADVRQLEGRLEEESGLLRVAQESLADARRQAAERATAKEAGAPTLEAHVADLARRRADLAQAEALAEMFGAIRGRAQAAAGA